MRQVIARGGPVTFDGEVYELPAQGEGCTGLGKPLQSMLNATPEVPIYSASFTPGGLRVSGGIADGVLPVWYEAGAKGRIDTMLLSLMQPERLEDMMDALCG